DASGNVNYCMVEVQVQDKIPPTITCPSDITVSCDFPLNLDDLSDFGDVVEDPADIQEFCVYDPTNEDADHSGFVCGVDGLVVDNCGVDIDIQEFPFLNNCGVGYIIRRFTASDANGSAYCDQIITVKNFDPITTESIIWPLDYHGAECSQGTDPDDLPPPFDRPIINEDHCDLVGINYEDQVFNFADGACFKILR